MTRMTARLPRPHLPSAQQFAAQLPSAHLSDEAVAAFADGALAAGPRTRAQQHLGDCAECRDAVRDQRRATAALRSAPSPCLPAGLTDRLRNLPGSTALPVNARAPAALSAGNQPMFAAFSVRSTVAAAPVTPVIRVTPVMPAEHRRGASTAGIAVLAATVVAVSMLAGTAASAGGVVQSPAIVPAGPALSNPTMTVMQFYGTGRR